MGDKSSFVVYSDWEEKTASMSDEDLGKFFRAIFRYVKTGQPPDSTPMVNLAFAFIKGRLDADSEKYEARRIRNSEIAKNRRKRDGRDETPNADQSLPDNSSEHETLPDVTRADQSAPNITTGIPTDTTAHQTPVISDICNLLSDNCVSTDVDTSFCAEPKAGSAPEQPKKPAEKSVFALPLNDGTEYGITQAQIDRWMELYPRVDIWQGLRNMLAWLEANPTNRKTRRGITRFINGWLAKDQDRGRNQRTSSSQDSPDAPLADWEKDWLDEFKSISSREVNT